MKKLLLTSFVVVACMFTATAVVVVEPDQGISTNALSKAIDDNPNETIFELKRDGVYVVDKEYTFNREIELRAQTGTGIMPLVVVVTDALGAKPSQVFKVEKNLTIKGIFFSGDTRGGGIVSHMFRATQGNLKIIFDDCYFDRIEQTVMRLDVAGCSVTMNNCIARNIAQTSNIDNGRIVDGRGQAQNEVIIKNSTFYNNVGQVYRYSSSAILNKLEIDHCTFYNSGYRMSLDLVINGKYTNNIMANCHWKASFSLDGGVTPPDAGSVISIDSLKTSVDDTRVFTVSNNNIYDNQDLTDAYSLYPNKVVKRQLVDPLDPWLVSQKLTMATNISEELSFKNSSPMPMDFIKAFFESTGTNSFNTTANQPFYVEEVAGVDPPEVETPFNFSYRDDKQSAIASTTGGPLGDPRWPVVVTTGLHNLNSKVNVQVFPNPVANSLKIRFNSTVSAKINIYDMDGRTVHFSNAYQKVASGQIVQIEMENLPSGTYLYSVETIENGQVKYTNGKVVK